MKQILTRKILLRLAILTCLCGGVFMTAQDTFSKNAFYTDDCYVDCGDGSILFCTEAEPTSCQTGTRSGIKFLTCQYGSKREPTHYCESAGFCSTDADCPYGRTCIGGGCLAGD
jgi:hypothetical protein